MLIVKLPVCCSWPLDRAGAGDSMGQLTARQVGTVVVLRTKVTVRTYLQYSIVHTGCSGEQVSGGTFVAALHGNVVSPRIIILVNQSI